MMQSQSQIRLNLRGLTELVLACALLSLITLAVWSWQADDGLLAGMEAAHPEAQRSFMTQILRHPAIMLSAIVAEFILLLSMVLALVPPAWWLRADHRSGMQSAVTVTPLRWVGTQMHRMGHPRTGGTEGHATVHEAGEPIDDEQPAHQASGYAGHPTGGPVPRQPQPGRPVPEQLHPRQSRPPAPGQAVDATEAPPAWPHTANPVTSPPRQEVEDFGRKEADDPLLDLANITDILSAAFDEDADVDPNLEALAHSLDEVSISTIQTTAREVAATFNQ